MIILDTYAWVEYFKGSEKGRIVKEYLIKEETATLSLVLVELSCKAEKEKWNFEEYLRFIKSKSSIIGMNEEIIIKCGKIYVEEKRKKPNFNIIDAIILTTAIKINAKILTGDKHFKDLKEAIMID